MNDDFELWIFIPISGFSIILCIAAIVGGVSIITDGVTSFLENYLSIIMIVLSVLAGILTIATSIFFKTPLFIISGSVISSQLIFFIYKGYQTVFAQNKIFWVICFFIFWIIYAIINLMITYYLLGRICSISYRNRKEPSKSTAKDLLLNEGGIGALGWILNIIFMLLV